MSVSPLYVHNSLFIIFTASTTGLRVVTAGFSCLAPGVHIVPHTGYRGYSSYIYRVHLGLVVPPGDVALRVGREQRAWRAGQVLAFNDLCLHEAWNRADRNRIVLLLDVERHVGALADFTPEFTNELKQLLEHVVEPTRRNDSAATSTTTTMTTPTTTTTTATTTINSTTTGHSIDL